MFVAFLNWLYLTLIVARPSIPLLMGLMTADTTLGLMRAWQDGKLSSDVSGRGMRRKVTMLIMVLVARGFEWYLGGGDYSAFVAYAFCLTEFLSIIENAGLMGVVMPAQLRAVLVALNSVGGKPSGIARHLDVADELMDALADPGATPAATVAVAAAVAPPLSPSLSRTDLELLRQTIDAVVAETLRAHVEAVLAATAPKEEPNHG